MFKSFRLSVVVCLLGIVVGLVPSSKAQSSDAAKGHINRLIKEAIGSQPIQYSASASQNAFDDAFRSQYRRLIQANRDYAVAAAQIDTASIKQLGTPQSLSFPSAAELGLKQLHLGYRLEVQHEQRVLGIYSNLRRIFETADWATASRPQLLKILRSTTVVPALARQKCIAAEKLWIDSMDDLYRYVSVHNSELHLIDDTITIDDPVIEREFNTRIIAENARRTQFLEAKQAYQRMQSQAFRSIAIDPTILGVK